MESGTSSRREMKPDPMPEADGRDAHPYLVRMVFAGGLGLAVGGLMRRTSRDAGPYLGWLGQHAVLPLPGAGHLTGGGAWASHPPANASRYFQYPEIGPPDL